MNFDDILNPPPRDEPLFPAGTIRTSADDFEVEELPAYLPDGAGEHTYLWIEKRGLAAAEMISRLARTLRIRTADIGVAGQKDRHAVTRQFVSVPAACEIDSDRLVTAGIRILSSQRHRHKLRTGHLKGNRFRILVRNPSGQWNDTDAEKTRQRLLDLSQTGFPSCFGRQRFGHSGNTLTEGLAYLKGELSRRHWPQSQQLFMKRMVLSAVQSAVFNLVVADRVRQGTVATPLPGDVVIRKHGSRPFLWNPDQSALNSADTAAEVYLPAGPMVGEQMLPSEGDVRQKELAALACLELTGSEFARHAKLCSGTRRVMVEFPDATDATRTDEGHLLLQFELRSGTYATVLLQELFGSVTDLGGSEAAAD